MPGKLRSLDVSVSGLGTLVLQKVFLSRLIADGQGTPFCVVSFIAARTGAGEPLWSRC